MFDMKNLGVVLAAQNNNLIFVIRVIYFKILHISAAHSNYKVLHCYFLFSTWKNLKV